MDAPRFTYIMGVAVSEQALIERLKRARVCRFIKINDRFQEGFPDLLYLFRDERIEGHAEAKLWERETGRARAIKFRPGQPAYMDGLARDGARVALIIGVKGMTDVVVCRENNTFGAPWFTRLAAEPWTFDTLAGMPRVWRGPPNEMSDALKWL